MKLRNKLARRRDRDVRLLALYSEWTTFFAWRPVRIKRPDVRNSKDGRCWSPGGADTIWLGFYRAHYRRNLANWLGLRFDWQYALMSDQHAWPRPWPKTGEETS